MGVSAKIFRKIEKCHHAGKNGLSSVVTKKYLQESGKMSTFVLSF